MSLLGAARLLLCKYKSECGLILRSTTGSSIEEDFRNLIFCRELDSQSSVFGKLSSMPSGEFL